MIVAIKEDFEERDKFPDLPFRGSERKRKSKAAEAMFMSEIEDMREP